MHYEQDFEPTNANDGDTWKDTYCDKDYKFNSVWQLVTDEEEQTDE